MTVKPYLFLAVLLFSLPQWVLSAETAGDEGEGEFSAANQLLFLSDHLTDIDYPILFHYTFVKQGALEKGFTDSIDMTSRDAPEGAAKKVEFRYFSDQRRRPFPPVSNARGNPIILAFLQRDVGEMDRVTGGDWRYFQKRIKQALENAAEVEPVTFEYNEQSVEGTRIRIAPYAKDQYRGRMGDYADKYYEFILSDQVPGEVYEMRTLIVAKGKAGPEDDRVLMEEKLTLDSTKRLDRQEASK